MTNPQLSLVVYMLENGVKDENELYLEIKQKKNTDKSILEYKIIEESGKKAIEVNLKSKIMDVKGFPFIVKEKDNVNKLVEEIIKKI